MTGETADQPVFMKLVRDDNGIKWGSVILATALTVATGYLVAQAQRAGSDPDFMTQVKMRYHLAISRYALKEAQFWTNLAGHHKDMYDLVRM